MVFSKVAIAAFLCVINGVTSIPNYCPDTDIAPHSHPSDNQWYGWSCRRHAMTFRGRIDDLSQIDFEAMERSNKTTLAIHLTNRDASSLTADIFRPLKSLKHLDLNLNTTDLTEGIFDTLTNLEYLNLYTYQETIPAKLFKYLSKLQFLKLHIRHRSLRLKPHQRRDCPHFNVTPSHMRKLDQILNPNMFDTLTELTQLSIDCHCTAIDPKLFYFNSKLKKLKLSTYTHLYPNELLSQQSGLETLTLKAHASISISRKLLSLLHNINTLQIIGNAISFAPNAFENNLKLHSLTISGRIETLPKDIFKPLSNLHYLDIGSTYLSELEPTLIHYNTQLAYLRLENNGIKEIPINFFQNSQYLEHLVLDFNELTHLQKNLFTPLESLSNLYLQHNFGLELFCDYGWSNATLFPHLTSVYFHENRHTCLQPWVITAQKLRPSVEFIHSNDTHPLQQCRKIGIVQIPKIAFVNETISVMFKGPIAFVQHLAYWAKLDTIDECSDFEHMEKNAMAHEMVAIANSGEAEFTFTQSGKFILVYKYGKNAPFLSYFNVMIVVE